MSLLARRAVVSGRVQGVAFRHHTKVLARECGLKGWVRNLSDGRVEVWFEGAAEPVERLSTWLASGPPAARVDVLEVDDVEPVGHEKFVVRFD